MSDPITEHQQKQAALSRPRSSLLQPADIVGGRDAFLDPFVKVIDPATGLLATGGDHPGSGRLRRRSSSSPRAGGLVMSMDRRRTRADPQEVDGPEVNNLRDDIRADGVRAGSAPTGSGVTRISRRGLRERARSARAERFRSASKRSPSRSSSRPPRSAAACEACAQALSKRISSGGLRARRRSCTGRTTPLVSSQPPRRQAGWACFPARVS